MSFATVEDVATRKGRALTALEAGTVDYLLEAATASIAASLDKSDAWADALTPVPRILKIVCVELVVRAMGNPESLATLREQLGAYSISQGYRDVADGGGLLLTKTEELLVRRAVFGRTSVSVVTESLADDCCVICGLSPRLHGGEWICGCSEGS